MLDEGVDMAHVNEGISQGAGHPGIYLGDYVPGALRSGLDDVHRYPVGAETVVVGRRYLDQGDIDGHGAGAKQPRDIHQIDRRVVCASFGHGLAACGGDKK